MNSLKLKSGDRIGLCSPSSPGTVFGKARYERAKRFLSEKGFILTEGILTDKSDFYRSGTIKERVNEFNLLIRDPEIKCIISTIGGLNSNSLLPYIDYVQLMATPKIIIGYSDFTAILLAIYHKTGINTFYGPAMIPSFGELDPILETTYGYFKDILIDDFLLPFEFKNPEVWTDEFIPWGENENRKIMQKNKLVTLSGGIVEGRLIGGNLDTLLGIWGSEYMPPILQGDILFIEDGMHTIETAERNFSLLKLNGVFDRISGLIIGKHELFNDRNSNRKYYDVLMEVIGETDIPILAEFDCGHTKPMFTIPIGCKAMLDATNQKLFII